MAAVLPPLYELLTEAEARGINQNVMVADIAARPAAAIGVRPEPNAVDRNAIKEAARAGRIAPSASYAPSNLTDNEILVTVPAAIKQIASGQKRTLIGTTYSDIVGAILEHKILSNATNNPSALLKDLIIAVYVAYTISDSWWATYANMSEASLFKGFDITGRSAPTGDKGKWVANSAMNSTALHLAGYLVVENSPAGTFLGKVKQSKGTPFALVNNGSPQARIMAEAAASLSAEDRAAAAVFGAQMAKAVRIVNLIFGDAGGNIDVLVATANRFARGII
jgi:hypothetical protein